MRSRLRWRSGDEVRSLGEIESNMAAIIKLVRKLEANYKRITFCYEAGPTGTSCSGTSKRSGTSASWWHHRCSQKAWRSGEDQPTGCGELVKLLRAAS